MHDKQTEELAKALVGALDTVLYAYDKGVVVDAATVQSLRNISRLSKELLGG